MFSPKSEAGGLGDHHSIIKNQNQLEDQGDPPPVYLKNGPIQIRRCTNLCCCLLFLIITGAFSYLWTMAFLNQKIEKLMVPVDADGRKCGSNLNDNYPYIYFATPQAGYLYRTVCVSQCPTAGKPMLCNVNSAVTSCQNNQSPTDPTKQILVYDSKLESDNICVPVDPNLYSIVQPALIIGDLQEAISNIQKSVPLIAASAGITLLQALVFTLLLYFLTTCITWIFLIVYILFTFLLGTICFYCFLNAPLPIIGMSQVQQQHSQGLTNNPIIFAFAIVFWILALNAFFTVLTNITKIKFMIGIIKLATKFLASNKSVIIIPIVFFALIMCVVGLWLVSSIFIISNAKLPHTPGQQVLPFDRLIPNLENSITIAVSFIGFIWLRQQLLSFAHFLVASTCAIWYFTANKKQKEERSILWMSIKIALRYHMGSIAAGAIYLFFFGPMASAFNWFYASVQKYKYRTANQCLQCTVKCCLLLCCCCDKWIRFINSLSFVMIVMTSEDFCAATKQAYFIMRRNSKDFTLLSGLGDSFTHFGKMFIFLLTSIGCMIYLTHDSQWQQEITQPIYPAILIGFVSLSTATLFMDVFGQSADALLLTFFTDLEVEKYHFGKEGSGACPNEIKDIVHHLRQKQKILYG